MLRILQRPDQLSTLTQLARSLSCSVALASPSRSEKSDVPAGHQNSDLRSVACHIGLNRRRDLSLREDLCLFQPGGKATVGEIFKVSTVAAGYLGQAYRAVHMSSRFVLFRVIWWGSLGCLIWGVSAQTSMCQTTCKT